MFGLFVSQSGKSINSVTIINKEKHDCFHEEQREQYEESCKNLINLRRLYNKNRWINEHSNYIKSEQWKQKRELVLKRDNYLCQACLTEKATQVHHTSYKHWRNEPLFELVSVCEMCHEKITTLDRLE
jgi:5-methylcytosine-specific restriction endonuclease McrA